MDFGEEHEYIGASVEWATAKAHKSRPESGQLHRKLNCLLEEVSQFSYVLLESPPNLFQTAQEEHFHTQRYIFCSVMNFTLRTPASLCFHIMLHPWILIPSCFFLLLTSWEELVCSRNSCFSWQSSKHWAWLSAFLGWWGFYEIRHICLDV